MKVTKAQVEANRAHIVETASTLFRERGYDGVGVAELMATAGLTHGGFYRHFGSKAELLAEAAACGVAKTKSLMDGVDMADFIRHYLSREHRDDRSGGCTLAALSGDAARQPDAIKATFATGLENMLADVLAAGEHAVKKRSSVRGLGRLIRLPMRWAHLCYPGPVLMTPHWQTKFCRPAAPRFLTRVKPRHRLLVMRVQLRKCGAVSSRTAWAGSFARGTAIRGKRGGESAGFTGLSTARDWPRATA